LNGGKSAVKKEGERAPKSRRTSYPIRQSSTKEKREVPGEEINRKGNKTAKNIITKREDLRHTKSDNHKRD